MRRVLWFYKLKINWKKIVLNNDYLYRSHALQAVFVLGF